MSMVGWKNKQVFIKTKDSKFYQGRVINEGDDYILIIDKYGKNVFLKISDLLVLKEESF